MKSERVLPPGLSDKGVRTTAVRRWFATREKRRLLTKSRPSTEVFSECGESDTLASGTTSDAFSAARVL
jgi:hypothetical protein